MSFDNLSKVELHLHLDCAISYAVASRIDPTITPADYRNRFIAPAKCADLADFLGTVTNTVRLMQTEEQLKLVTEDLFTQLERDNVIYAEIRFAPLLHTQKGLSAHEVVRIVEATVAESIKKTGVEARILLCTLRHFTEEQSLATIKMVEQFMGSHVAGFDIAGDEAGYPIDAHVKAFQYARERKIPRTAHAGEARGPESIWETMRSFHPSRIGHGVRSIEDPVLIDQLRSNRIHLEVCPTCNVQIDIYPRYDSHPVDELYRSGLSLNINTDARTTSDITLNQEYDNLNRVFGWEQEQFLKCNIQALRAAFIPEQTRKELIDRLVEGYQQL